MHEIGKIAFGPRDISPLERRLEREPGFTVEYPPRGRSMGQRARVAVQRTHWEGCYEYHDDCWPPEQQFIGGTSRFAAVQDEE